MSDPKFKTFYISFGQIHAHRYNGKTLDCNCLAEISAPDEGAVRRFCQDEFKNEYFTVYTDTKIRQSEWKYFPRGAIKIGIIPDCYIEEVK